MTNYKNDLTIGDKILMLLATNQFLPKRTMRCLSSAKYSGSDAAKRLKEKNLIKETNRIYSVRYKQHTHYINVSMYSITQKGLVYLSNKEVNRNTVTYKNYGRWIDFLPQPIERLEIFSSGYNSAQIIGHSDIGTGSLIAFVMNATYSPCFLKDQQDILSLSNDYDENDQDDIDQTDSPVSETDSPMKENEQNNSHLLKEIIWNTLMECEPQYEIHNGHYFIGNDKEEIRFVNRKICKQIYRKSGTSDIKIQYGNFAGIFDGPYFASMLYVLPRRGMHWGQYIRNKEFYLYRYYMSEHSKHPTHRSPAEQTPVYASLIVENARMFEAIFTDNKEKRKKAIQKLGYDPLGDGLTNFTVFPLTYDGIMAYKEYLLHAPDYSRERILKLGIESGYYSQNPNNLLTFPLIDKEGTEYYEGSVIDIINLKRLVSSAKDNPERKYKIICYRWQAEFYQRILPDAQYSFLD